MLAVLLLAGGSVIFFTAYNHVPPDGSGNASVFLVYTNAGMVLQLLDTGQIDTFYLWEPNPQIASAADVGKIIATQDDLPPKGRWSNEPTNVLVMDQGFIHDNPEPAALLSALTSAGCQYIIDFPEKSVNYTVRWLYGNKSIIVGNKTLNPTDIESKSMKELIFEPVKTGHPDLLINSSVVNRGIGILDGGELQPPATRVPVINFGYLSSDLHAPLFVLLDDPEYFMEKYGFALIPEDSGTGRHTKARLVAHNQTYAEVNIIPGQNGGGLMSNIGQRVIEVTFVGTTPAQTQIALGNPAEIIQPFQSGGSSLVVSMQSPSSDWASFVTWARERSASGQPLILATVQTSIQETMIREALKEEGIEVSLLKI